MYGNVGASDLEARFRRALRDPQRQLEELLDLGLDLADQLCVEDARQAEAVLAAVCEQLVLPVPPRLARRHAELATRWADVAAALEHPTTERRAVALARRFLDFAPGDTWDERRAVVARCVRLDLASGRVDDAMLELISMVEDSLGEETRPRCLEALTDLAVGVTSVLVGPEVLARIGAAVAAVEPFEDARWQESILWSILAAAQFSLDHDSEARDDLGRARALAQRDGSTSAITSWVAAIERFRSGDVVTAHALARELLASDGLTMGVELRLEVLALAGECSWILGYPAAAASALMSVVAAMDFDDRRLARCHEILAEVARADGRHEAAYEHLELTRSRETAFVDRSTRANDHRSAVSRSAAADERVIVLPGSGQAHADRVVELEQLLEARSQQLDRARAEMVALSDRATHDPLTGLANRSHLTQLLGDLVGRGIPTSIIVVDIDRFGRVNGSLGHTTGDELLVEVASRIRSAVGPEDTVARWGGDEFVVLLPALADPTAVGSVARSILTRVNERWHVHGDVVTPSATIGIALARGGMEDAATTLGEADAALARAKSRGRNRIEWFGEELGDAARRRYETERMIHDAMEQGHFELYFQPIHPNDGLSPLASEALLRLNHPDGRVLAPGVFLEVAEDAGLAGPLGVWVIGEACRIAGTWRGLGVPFHFSVNVSASQLDADLPVVVAAALAENGVPPGCLTLELTEHLLLEADDVQIAALGEIRSAGVLLALDDFGTAYSSLNHLRQFPVDVVKIDRSFIAGICHDPADMAIVRAVVDLSRTFGFRVVAEGVETADQLDQQRRLGCNAAQGYLIGRPRPAAEFGRMLASRPLLDLLMARRSH